MLTQKQKYRNGKTKYCDDNVHIRLREIRSKLDKTQKEMAEILEVSQPYYSNLEDGKRILSTIILKLLVENGISVDYLLSGKGYFLLF